MDKIYDMLIIGGGPAGYTAALYAARSGLSVLLIEKLYAGGQMTQTHQIDNYPGFSQGIDGFTLAVNMQQQAQRFGVESVTTQAKKLDLTADPKRVDTDNGSFYGKTVVIATGADPRPLGLPREREFLGNGLHYCAACDGNFYRDKTVVVVGGGNTAVEDALLLSRIAEKVILVHRRDTFRADHIYQSALVQAPNVEFHRNCAVTQLLGQEQLSGVRLQNLKTGEETEILCDGVFVNIGREPATSLLDGQLALDKSGYIIADEATETGIDGVYAVGDVRVKQVRQIVTAVADGAIASHSASEYLARH